MTILNQSESRHNIFTSLQLTIEIFSSNHQTYRHPMSFGISTRIIATAKTFLWQLQHAEYSPKVWLFAFIFFSDDSHILITVTKVMCNHLLNRHRLTWLTFLEACSCLGFHGLWLIEKQCIMKRSACESQVLISG